MKIKNNKLCTFQSKLIQWHKSNGRNFLWRGNQDPFQILVAELILKRTGALKAEEVINIILKKYKSLKVLSLADQSEIKPLFKSLGLINRSKKLIDICKEIVNKYDGKVPTNYNELVKLHGIGQYIANAILCFAYNKRVAIVDGSVSRILKRYYNYKSEKRIHADKLLWKLAEECLPKRK